MGRKRSLPLLQNIEITAIGSEGNAIARVDNQVVFVPMLVPGDIVDIRVIRKKKNFMEGVPVKFHRYSPLRVTPECKHFGVCGGCRWQHLPYHEQLLFKQRQVSDNLERIGKTELPVINPILGSPDEYYYRNKLEFTFSNRRWLTSEEISQGSEIARENALGFHIPGLFDKVLSIENCYLQPEPSNRIRNAVREYCAGKGFEYYDFREHKGFLRNLMIRNTLSGDVMAVFIFGEERMDDIADIMEFASAGFPEIKTLLYIINRKRNDSFYDLEPVTWKGEGFLTEEMEGLKFRIGPKSFYQTNPRQAEVLYRTAREYAGLTGKEVVYDLYTGTGTIACFVSGGAAKVIGVEYVEEAVIDARINASINGIGNVEFFAGDMKDVLSESFFAANGKPDVIITDPPRAGMHDDVIKSIRKAEPSRIVYVSCNPATQARDINLLSDLYYVESVQPVDMFPHTHHVENIVLLVKRDKPII